MAASAVVILPLVVVFHRLKPRRTEILKKGFLFVGLEPRVKIGHGHTRCDVYGVGVMLHNWLTHM